MVTERNVGGEVILATVEKKEHVGRGYSHLTDENRAERRGICDPGHGRKTVHYTQLTLPTKRIVSSSWMGERVNEKQQTKMNKESSIATHS